ncbi:hypothetical protein [Clavibacter zhangzhiyongii]|uniref:hypothetical protein n=1 Tax=Clavibacter zhangzhiyongii TaxID=2768071 RepID=UPI001F218AFD|nr:hypothetical protein [Clavibacter zhangzhiyongii]
MTKKPMTMPGNARGKTSTASTSADVRGPERANVMAAGVQIASVTIVTPADSSTVVTSEARSRSSVTSAA